MYNFAGFLLLEERDFKSTYIININLIYSNEKIPLNECNGPDGLC